MFIPVCFRPTASQYECVMMRCSSSENLSHPRRYILIWCIENISVILEKITFHLLWTKHSGKRSIPSLTYNRSTLSINYFLFSWFTCPKGNVSRQWQKRIGCQTLRTEAFCPLAFRPQTRSPLNIFSLKLFPPQSFSPPNILAPTLFAHSKYFLFYFQPKVLSLSVIFVSELFRP